MDIHKLPYLSLNFFYHQFSPAAKRIFWVICIALLVTGALLMSAFHAPEFWSLEVREVADTHIEPVVVNTIQHNYRDFDLSMNAYWQEVSYTAGPINPSPFPIIIFWLLQAIGWGVLLAAASQIKSRWAYLFYLLFAFFLHFSDVAKGIYSGPGHQILEFSIGLGILAFAFVLQEGILRMKLGYRVLTFTGILLFIFGIAFGIGGWATWHQMSANSFSYLTLISILMLFFIGKEPTNLIIFAATNRPNRQNRLDHRLMGAILVLLLIAEFFALIQYLRFDWAPVVDLGIKPLHLIVLSAILMPFTTQNQYHFVKRIIASNTSFTLLLSSLSLIMLSFFFLVFSQGDEIFVSMIERLAIIFFFSIGLVHTIYLFGNFMPLLQQKVNLYYLLTTGRRIPFATIWFAGIIALVFAEGKESWKTPRLVLYSQALQHADHSMVMQERQEAMEGYENASFFAPGNIKAHYNLASLIVANPKRTQDALHAYQRATAVQYFPHAHLNAANLQAYEGTVQAARTTLKKGLADGGPNPYLANNLGLYYLEAGNPDSAILSFQAALQADLSLSSVYSNLAHVYHRFEREAEALAFFNASIDTQHPSAAAFCNALFYQLLTQQPVLEANTDLTSVEDYFVQYNLQLNQLRGGEHLLAAKGVKSLLSQDPSPETLILDSYLMFLQDSVENARSRMKYVAESYPSHRAQAHTLMGMAYYQHDVPEMARYFFLQAAEAGDPFGGLYAAKMELDLGKSDSAFEHLSTLRIAHDTLWNPVAKELGMLYSAIGEELIANTEWDMGSLSRNERIRVARYADTLSDGNIALNHFLPLLEQDSTDSTPFIEMGKIYNRMKDVRALENLRYGRSLHPRQTALDLELARAHFIGGNIDSATLLLESIQSDSALALSIGELNAELALAAGDTGTAVSQLELIFQSDPFRQSTVIRLAELFRESTDWDKGNQLITTALNLNDQQPVFWYYYAVFSQAWNLPEDAGYGAAKAIELTDDLATQQAIASEFATELRTIVSD